MRRLQHQGDHGVYWDKENGVFGEKQLSGMLEGDAGKLWLFMKGTVLWDGKTCI